MSHSLSPHTTYASRRASEALPRDELQTHQLRRLNALLGEILPANRFYAEKLASVSLPLESLDELGRLPFTYKTELLGDARHGSLAANLTYPPEQYTHYYQTSGTRGRPLVVLDTADDWRGWLDCWQYVFDVAELTAADRAVMAFSFGPFIGFWTAYEAAIERGCLMIPAGGMSSLGRLELIRNSGATVLFCTPSYALHLAEIAAERKIPLSESAVRTIIVAGEPGGSVAATRARIEQAWQARVVDHAGATEVGPWGYADPQGLGLHVLETEFIAEFFSVHTGHAAQDGELAEMVLTNLGRRGAPVIRYRTGDLVRPRFSRPGPNRFAWLEGGVLGRSDDMVIIRGVNIFPSAIEQILHGFPEVVEYRITARRRQAMDQLEVEVEDHLERPQRIAEELRLRLGLNIEVRCAPAGSLPRFEGKGRRFVDLR